jgi:hypothetical protein
VTNERQDFAWLAKGVALAVASTEDLEMFSRENLTCPSAVTTMRDKAKDKI